MPSSTVSVGRLTPKCGKMIARKAFAIKKRIAITYKAAQSVSFMGKLRESSFRWF